MTTGIRIATRSRPPSRPGRAARAASALVLALLAAVGCAGSGTPAPPAHGAEGAGMGVGGVVFHDRNENGVRDRFERGVAGVAVSNGRDVARTDWRGRYRLPVTDDTILFVVKPGGWAVPIGANNLPRFFNIHKPAGSPADLRFPGVAPTDPLPASVDFPLTRSSEPETFEVLLFGDPQPYTTEEIDLLAHDVIEELIGSDASFGISLGDLVGDDLALFEPLNRAVSLIGIPWYSVPGNHDVNYRAASDAHADETWERVYGPGTYAFQYASAHFIMLDDVVYGGALPEGNSTQNYVGGLNGDQLAFVRGYLAGVPSDELVVLAMHIPLKGEAPTLDVPQRRGLFAALAAHPHTFSISSHRHTQSHQFFGPEDGWYGPEPHHHLIQGTTSGSWWLGVRDELGIPHATMRDGTPNGYSILRIAGNGYSVRYKAARRPADHQMHVFAPDVISAAESETTEVQVNVFSGSERSRVEMRLRPDAACDSECDSGWLALVRAERPDPYFLELKRRELESEPRPARPLPPADPSTHLWVGRLPAHPAAGSVSLEVRTTDMFGAIFTTQRVLRVEAASEPAIEPMPGPTIEPKIEPTPEPTPEQVPGSARTHLRSGVD
jgi:hypothetical protein